MKPWLPALAALSAAVLLATIAGVVLGGLPMTPESSSPVVMKTVTPGALEKSGIRLTHAVPPIECTPAAWLHLSLGGHCPISQSQAEAAARSALPVYKPVPVMVGAAAARAQFSAVAPVPVDGPPQVRETVLAWADMGTNRPVHALVWVVAVDEPLAGGAMCAPPPVVRTTGAATTVPRACITAPRYLVFVDASSGKILLSMARP